MENDQLPAEIERLLKSMTPEIRDNLCMAVEIGRWPDGSQLTDTQRQHAMRAVMLWDSQHGQEEEEPFRVLKGGKLIRQQDKKVAQEQPSDDTPEHNINIRWQ